MVRWVRIIANAGSLRIITALGGLFLALSAGRVLVIVPGSEPLVEALIDFVLIGLPGIGLLYGRYWLARSTIHPEAYPRVVLWCLAGLVALLGVVGLMIFDPVGSIDRPLRSVAIGTGIGAVGGLLIGLNEARAISRAHEAERHRDDLRFERDLREQIVETSPIGISVVNADRSTRMVNERAAEIVGLSRDELLKYDYDESMFETTDADGDPLGSGVFTQVLSSGTKVYDAERKMIRPDGQQIWLSVNGAPLRDPSGAVSAVIFAFQNITENKRLEKDLKRTVESLEQSNDRLRQFAYAASHDLQEPLRMVSSYVQLLDDRYMDDLDTDAREFIDYAIDGADRMRQMIQALLSYSRLEHSEHEFELVDCEAVITQVLVDFQTRIEETNAEITTTELPSVTANEAQLRQLFQNLISNTLKYIRDEPPRVEITARQRNTHWEFAITDNGIGIEPEYTDRIFDVFKRLHGDGEYDGTGIGLSLCQRIVEHHGGRIWVESEPNEGSTFYFTLAVDGRSGSPVPV